MRVFLSWLSSFACQFLGTYMHTLVYEHISVLGVILPKLLYYISVLLSPYCICVFRESPSDTDRPVGSSLSWYFKVESLHKVAFKGDKPHPLTRCGGRYLSDSSCISMHGRICVSMWLHSFVFCLIWLCFLRGHEECDPWTQRGHGEVTAPSFAFCPCAQLLILTPALKPNVVGVYPD